MFRLAASVANDDGVAISGPVSPEVKIAARPKVVRSRPADGGTEDRSRPDHQRALLGAHGPARHARRRSGSAVSIPLKDGQDQLARERPRHAHRPEQRLPLRRKGDHRQSRRRSFGGRRRDRRRPPPRSSTRRPSRSFRSRSPRPRPAPRRSSTKVTKPSERGRWHDQRTMAVGREVLPASCSTAPERAAGSRPTARARAMAAARTLRTQAALTEQRHLVQGRPPVCQEARRRQRLQPLHRRRPGDRLRRGGLHELDRWAENIGCRSGNAYDAVLALAPLLPEREGLQRRPLAEHQGQPDFSDGRRRRLEVGRRGPPGRRLLPPIGAADDDRWRDDPGRGRTHDRRAALPCRPRVDAFGGRRGARLHEHAQHERQATDHSSTPSTRPSSSRTSRSASSRSPSRRSATRPSVSRRPTSSTATRSPSSSSTKTCYGASGRPERRSSGDPRVDRPPKPVDRA